LHKFFLTVRAYLVEQGVEGDRITLKGEGGNFLSILKEEHSANIMTV
jgi:outer membrane protein OmpA-like peptidoglycan-associated protein